MKVLLVDDNDSLRAARLTQLEESDVGAELFEAGCVDDALRIADAVNPDIIVLDLYLGTAPYDGLKVFDHVRHQPYGRDTHIVALTAYSDVKSRLEGRGFDRILIKADYHYDDDEIVRIVRDRMSSQRQEKPGSSPAGPPASSDDKDQLNQAIHDIWELKTQVKRLVEPPEVSHADSRTRDVAEHNATAPNLLIVEDDRRQQSALADFFKAVGYRVTVANGISDAKDRQKFDAYFDAYIVDVLLQHSEEGTDISRLLTAKQARNVVFTSARPDKVQELQRNGFRAYDKNAKQLDKLLELVRQVAPLRSNPLVNENEVAVRGKRLLKDIDDILERDDGTSLTDSDVAEKCKAFADWVLQLLSVDTNKYIVASKYLARAIKKIEGIPFMVESRRTCGESHSRIYERRLYGSGEYFSWFVHHVFWGGITGMDTV